MEFLKKHYEKIVLCVVLLGLAAAAVWMHLALQGVREKILPPPPPPSKFAPVVPMDLSTDEVALAQLTNPPPIILSGAHNLFNPVLWKRDPNGTLLKILKTGPDALSVTSITELYTIIAYDHASGGGSGVYVMSIQEHCDTNRPPRKKFESIKVNEKPKSGLYIIRGIKGAPDDPAELELEITATGDTVAVTKDKPYERVDSHIADMRYDPERKNLLQQHVGDTITLDREMYKIVEITSNAVRVESARTKVTEIKWNRTP
ncbi:MAG: hypothetical protein ABSG59_11730 [Verrucomicrobiota bacterium]|jgi:hypothetical protein